MYFKIVVIYCLINLIRLVIKYVLLFRMLCIYVYLICDTLINEGLDGGGGGGGRGEGSETL